MSQGEDPVTVKADSRASLLVVQFCFRAVMSLSWILSLPPSSCSEFSSPISASLVSLPSTVRYSTGLSGISVNGSKMSVKSRFVFFMDSDLYHFS